MSETTLQPTSGRQLAPARATIRYAVDAKDRVTVADEALRSHMRPSLPWPMVGRTAGEMAPSENVRDLYRGLLARTRAGNTVSFIQRFWEGQGTPRCVCEMSPLPDDGVQFELFALPSRSDADDEAAAAASSQLLKICAWCLDVNIGRWLSVEHAVNRAGLLDLPAPRPVTHGICPECLERVRNEDL